MATAYSTLYQPNIITRHHSSSSFTNHHHNERELRNLQTFLFDTQLKKDSSSNSHKTNTSQHQAHYINNVHQRATAKRLQRSNTTDALYIQKPSSKTNNIQRSETIDENHIEENRQSTKDIQRSRSVTSPQGHFIKNIQRSNTSPAALVNKNQQLSTPRKRLQRQGYSFDTGLQQYNKYFESVERRQAILTSTPRIRKSSSVLRDIIIESVSENNMGENQDIVIKNNNTNSYKNGTVILKDGEKIDGTEVESKHQKEYVRDPKKVYKHRKHHSDYGIVFQGIDDQINIQDEVQFENEATTNTRARTVSYSSDHDDVIDGNLSVNGGGDTRLHSKSDSNLDESGIFGRPNCRSPKSNSHVDITSTKMYKDIYADNLRQYGFLFAKQMGLSPDQLRRTYQKSRQRVIERRERANTLVSDSSHRERTDSLPTVVGLRERSSTTLSDFATPPSRRLSSSSTSSLTDITNIGILEKHKKTTTTVIRRKKGNKLPRDPTKRLSAPLMDSLKLPIENDTSVASLRQQLASMSVPDLTQHSTRNEPCLEQRTLQPTSATSSPTQRKLSDESSKRLKEARARQEWRMSRLKSFEGVLSQANSWMRDAKTKHHDENSTKESKPIKSDAPQNAPIANENNNATEVSYPIKSSDTNNEDSKLSKIDHSDI